MSPTPRFLAASGRRDRLVQLVPIVDGEDTSGFPTESDGTPEIEVWASKEDMGGRERIAMAQESAPFDSRFILPFSDAYNPNRIDVPKVFALDCEGRRYDIVAAAEIGRREGVELITLARMG